MITPKNITKKQAKKILSLVESITRCDILARYGHVVGGLEFIDWKFRKRAAEEKLREYIFGYKNEVELGVFWRILENNPDDIRYARRMRKKRKKKIEEERLKLLHNDTSPPKKKKKRKKK